MSNDKLMKTEEAVDWVEQYRYSIHSKTDGVIELLQQGEKLKKDLTQFLEKENPYPEDVFLVIKKEDYDKINDFFKKELGYPMDRLSGTMGRRIYKTIIEDLKEVIR